MSFALILMNQLKKKNKIERSLFMPTFDEIIPFGDGFIVRILRGRY
jgi:hypothetical protein